MDTLTHALSGALVARLIATRQAPHAATATAFDRHPAAGRFSAFWDGRPGAPMPWQAVVVGLVAGAFPDIDALVQLAGDVAYLRHHRGVTHSLLMAPLWAALVAAAMALMFGALRQQPGGWKSLYPVALAGIVVHIAGDWITQFGTMLLAPFSDTRFGLGAIFIIDLVFTGLLIVGLLLAALLPRRRWPAALGLAAAAGWVVVGWVGQQQAVEIGRQQARAQGWAVERIVVMPRPASPFNWTVAVDDGKTYHVAHVNTQRQQRLVATADDSFIRRFSAAYVPAAQAEWSATPRMGDPATTPAWVAEAWQHEAFAFYRWFSLVPALEATEEGVASDGRRERCAWFRDLRFGFPGRDEAPFRYGLCLLGEAGNAGATVYKREAGQRVPL
jgi:inner membrane protein